jgi:hypothetical protein
MLKRQDDERLQRSGDEIRPVRAGVTVRPLHIHQSLGLSAFVVSLVKTDPSPPSDTSIALGNVMRDLQPIRRVRLARMAHCWFVKMMARVSREIPAGQGRLNSIRPELESRSGRGAGRLPLNGASRMKPTLMVARPTEAGWFPSGGATLERHPFGLNRMGFTKRIE